MSLSLHPLSSTDRMRGWTEARQEAWRTLVTPFVEQGILSPSVVQVVDLLGRRAGELRPPVLLAAALAVRAPRNGHVYAALPDIGVDTADERLPIPAAEPNAPPLPWPPDRDAWRIAVAQSPLVQPDARTAEPRPFVFSGHRLYPQRTWKAEETLARLLTDRAHTRTQPSAPHLLQSGLAALFEPPAPGQPLDRQLLAAALACLRGLTVISGGPGTGKTWTVRNILTLLFAQHLASGETHPFRVAVGAPTGKAAARVQTALTADLATFIERRGRHALPDGTDPIQLHRFFATLEARTVHRLLRVDPRMPGRFQHGPANPLPVDLVLIDETSMLDLTLMTRLVGAVPSTARLVLLGDHHQLASVDAGCVLADLCRAARFDAPRLGPEARLDLGRHAGLTPSSDFGPAPSTGLHDCGIELLTSRRFTRDSGVGAVARAILAGDGPGSRKLLVENDHPDTGWRHLAPDSMATPDFARLIVDGYAPMLRRLLDGADHDTASFHRHLLREFDRFRLLCAHRRGRRGVEGLVTLTERLLGRHLHGFKPRGPTYIGRPVLITRNDYSVNRYNGDVGLIVERDGYPVAVFPDATTGVAYLSPARLPPHETVFAMTIHKSQGSEFDHTVVVLPSQTGPILTRELIYTGVTRAKDRLTVAGTAEVWDHGVQREVARASGLADRLVSLDD